MKTYFTFACFVFAAIGLAWGQPMLLFLYKTAGPDGKYVLVLSRTYGGGTSSSDVIMSDSFIVQRDDSDYEVIFTNGVRFHAESTVLSSPSVRTNFVQATIPCGIIGFPTNTKVLFDGAMTDVGHIQLCGVTNTNKVGYRGDLIAHVAHNGLSFSIAVDQHDPAYLRIIIPERFSPPTPLPNRRVKVRVLMTDDSRKEGIARSLPSAGGGGWVDVNYSFPLGRSISVDDIHSVSISIDGDEYEVFPF
jgi:hypothetical protein